MYNGKIAWYNGKMGLFLQSITCFSAKYTGSDSNIEMRQEGCLNLCQVKPALKEPNFSKLGDWSGHKGNAKPTQHKPIVESRAVYNDKRNHGEHGEINYAKRSSPCSPWLSSVFSVVSFFLSQKIWVWIFVYRGAAMYNGNSCKAWRYWTLASFVRPSEIAKDNGSSIEPMLLKRSGYGFFPIEALQRITVNAAMYNGKMNLRLTVRTLRCKG
jgi:hypothetical protein